MSGLWREVCTANLIDFNAFSRVIFRETPKGFKELFWAK